MVEYRTVRPCNWWRFVARFLIYVSCFLLLFDFWFVSVNKNNVILHSQWVLKWSLGLFICMKNSRKHRTNALPSLTHSPNLRQAGLSLISLLSTIRTAPCLCQQITLSAQFGIYRGHGPVLSHAACWSVCKVRAGHFLSLCGWFSLDSPGCYVSRCPTKFRSKSQIYGDFPGRKINLW
jgi:hypothetical protein